MIDRPGIVAGSVLASAISYVITAFPWPKSMRWGAASNTESLRCAAQGIIALLGMLVLVEAVAKSFLVTSPLRLLSGGDHDRLGGRLHREAAPA